MKKIMFTGGGSAGHVTVNLALIPRFLEQGWEVEYIGSENGIEKELIAPLDKVRYHAIATGKLRRYVDIKNITDPFKVIKGVWQAYRTIKKRKPNAVFSKGGFVSVPVVVGAWLNKVPVVIHESDFTPGLANRISIPLATAVCTTFPETAKQLPSAKSHHVGAVIREEIRQGSAERGRRLCGFSDRKPVILVTGGSLGARAVNKAVREALPELLQQFSIVHLCGKNQLDQELTSPDYKQFEYVNEELPDILAMTDLVISRAGSNAIFEFLSLRKPMLLIPLTAKQSRGDQILNARSFEKSGYAEVLHEEDISVKTLVERVNGLYEKRDIFRTQMSSGKDQDALLTVQNILLQTAKK
ncbi:undecaprenyldiphospho-muramoylpentapeptide beta-N-acetylglucosaminyltransferase [Paenibacillaceae bacterium]|nr:undecaprenyldiphospho-muramoylpentapeptide beta-N-acetylglucosaminyltransferase [Paenibacillaceae bacterium]